LVREVHGPHVWTGPALVGQRHGPARTGPGRDRLRAGGRGGPAPGTALAELAGRRADAPACTRRRPPTVPSPSGTGCAPLSSAALPTAVSVAPIDSLAPARSGAGSWLVTSPSRDRYTLASTEPSTATPRDPPTIRRVLFTAEPAPARSRGTADIMDSVAGAMT